MYVHEHLPSRLPQPGGQSLTVAVFQSGRVPTAQTGAWGLDHPAEPGQMDWMDLQQSIGPILPSGPSPLDDQLHVPGKSIRSENNTKSIGNSLLFSYCTASCVSPHAAASICTAHKLALTNQHKCCWQLGALHTAILDGGHHSSTGE